MNRQWDEGSFADTPRRVIDGFDPRLRVGALLLLTAGVVAAREMASIACLTVFGVACLAMAGFSPRQVLRRALPLVGFGVLLAAVLPWTVPGTAIGGGWLKGASWEGLKQAAVIWWKATTVLFAALGLVGTLEIPILGHVLAHFHLPRKLVHLILFSVRYLNVLENEYHRLRTAIRLRGFRPGWNLWTFRTYGQLVGMLLVRSLARSERILAAMKCRGFRGYFYLWSHFHFTVRDLAFLAGLVLAGLIYCTWEFLL